MSSNWIKTVLGMVQHGPVVRVVIIRAEGSTPREAGAAMLISELGQSGTIGGGALEFESVKAARRLLDDASTDSAARWVREVREYPLGPELCQCCGGFAWVLFEMYTAAERATFAAIEPGDGASPMLLARHLQSGAPLQCFSDRHDAAGLPSAVAEPTHAMLTGAEPARVQLITGSPSEPAWFIEPIAPKLQRLYLYGAGHVGRELVRVTAGLGFGIQWVDTSPDRFPDPIAPHTQRLVAPDPAVIAAGATCGAFHLVMTYSHPMDLAICEALLKRGDFGYLGLIGSKTKRARFAQRLRGAGIPDATLQRMVSPIGISGLAGKAPAVIAVSVAAQLLIELQGRAAGIAHAKQSGRLHAAAAV
jgi:xanthine dehydrogenase accessory factor